jgi:hypothetical protein
MPVLALPAEYSMGPALAPGRESIERLATNVRYAWCRCRGTGSRRAPCTSRGQLDAFFTEPAMLPGTSGQLVAAVRVPLDHRARSASTPHRPNAPPIRDRPPCALRARAAVGARRLPRFATSRQPRHALARLARSPRFVRSPLRALSGAFGALRSAWRASALNAVARFSSQSQ